MQMRNEDLKSYLRDAAAKLGVSSEDILDRVLHLHIKDLGNFTQEMRPETKALFAEFDYGVRIRNPGLHYSMRAKYLGYRRERVAAPGAGERSQVFVSVLRKTAILDLVLPLEPASLGHIADIRDVTGIGHHGVGNARITIEDKFQLERFFVDFDFWIRSRDEV